MGLTKEQVLRIDGYLSKGEKSHKQIAAEENTTPKTISRIANGLTWHEVTKRPRRQVPRNPKNIVHQATLSATVNQILRGVRKKHKIAEARLIQLKAEWGFSLKRPLMWVEFETCDSVEAFATDGVIAWSLDALVELARGLGRIGHSKELPTFEASKLLSWPIGSVVRVVAEREKVFVLDRGVALHRRFVELAAKHRLEIRWAASERGIVYLTRAKSKRTVDTSSVVVACVATMELAMSSNVEELTIKRTTVEIDQRELLTRSKQKIDTLLTLIRSASTVAQQEALVISFIDAMRKRSYAVAKPGAEMVKDLKADGASLIDAVEDATTILADGGLDVIFLDVANTALEQGCWPYSNKPDYYLFTINDQG